MLQYGISFDYNINRKTRETERETETEVPCSLMTVTQLSKSFDGKFKLCSRRASHLLLMQLETKLILFAELFFK